MNVKQPRRGEETSRRILDAAEKLFAQHGYQATTLRKIAREAALREPGLYNHFQNKEALYRAVLDRGLRPMEAEIKSMLSRPVTPTDAMQLAVKMLRLNAQHPHMSALFFQAVQAGHDGSPAGSTAHWMLRLFQQGREVNRQVMPGDDETLLLQGFAMFVLCCGYFVAQPLLAEAGIDALSEPMLARQQKLIERVMRTFLVG